jgi:hypothetical protein
VNRAGSLHPSESSCAIKGAIPAIITRKKRINFFINMGSFGYG